MCQDTSADRNDTRKKMTIETPTTINHKPTRTLNERSKNEQQQKTSNNEKKKQIIQLQSKKRIKLISSSQLDLSANGYEIYVRAIFHGQHSGHSITRPFAIISHFFLFCSTVDDHLFRFLFSIPFIYLCNTILVVVFVRVFFSVIFAVRCRQ